MRSRPISQAEERCEQVDHAREILAPPTPDRDFAEVLRRIGPGEVVVVATADGWVVRGRIVRVGRDWLRVAEVRDEQGTARVAPGRVHEVRLGGRGAGQPGAGSVSGVRLRASASRSARYASSVSRLTRHTPFLPILRAGQVARAHERVHLRHRHVEDPCDIGRLQQGSGKFVVHGRARLDRVGNRPVAAAGGDRTGCRGRRRPRPVARGPVR